MRNALLTCAVAIVGCASNPAADPVAPVAPPIVVPLDEEPRADGQRATGETDAELDGEQKEPDGAQASDTEQQAGILGLLRDEDGKLGGTGEGLGGLQGDAIGDSFGAGGLGLRGTGSGGGGSGEGIGLGSIGTIGHGSGTGQGYGRGSGGLGKTSALPRVTPGAATFTGSLDKEVIRRVIRRNLTAIRYCYETQLVKAPRLSGKLVVAFVVAADGSVRSTKAESAFQSDVDACVVRTFGRMQFPRPDGGGSVHVRYPLVFSPGEPPAKKPADKAAPRDVK